MGPEDRRNQTIAGIGWMAIAMSGIGLVDAGAKWLAQSLSGLQVVWGYFLGMLVTLLVHGLVTRAPLPSLVTTARLGAQLGRAACLVASLSCLFVSLRYLPLAEATAISFTSPLFTVALAGPLLGERVGWRRWLAVSVGMAGTLLIVRPGTELYQAMALLPLFGAVFFAGFSIITRSLHGEDPRATLFFTFAGGTVIISLTLPLVWQAPSTLEAAAFLGFGALGALSHLSIVRAMRFTDASIVAPLNYVRLIWALALGALWFDEWPDVVSLSGAGIIVASGLYVVYGASRAARAS